MATTVGQYITVFGILVPCVLLFAAALFAKWLRKARVRKFNRDVEALIEALGWYARYTGKAPR